MCTVVKLTVGRGSQCAITDSSQATDGEAEDEALEVEPRALGEVEQAGRVPVSGHEQGLGQAKRCCQHAGDQHTLA